MMCKVSGCKRPARLNATRCAEHQRDYLKEPPSLRVSPAPLVRWPQFEAHVIENLRAARQALASAQGMAMSDGMIKWSGEARELAERVQTLIKEIEDNTQRVLQKSCR